MSTCLSAADPDRDKVGVAGVAASGDDGGLGACSGGLGLYSTGPVMTVSSSILDGLAVETISSLGCCGSSASNHVSWT